VTLPYPHAVLFDFDGVIADSAVIHRQAWTNAFYALFNEHMDAHHDALHAGLASSAISDLLARSIGQPERASALYDLKLTHLLQGPPPTKLPGVDALMALCRAHAIPYGIVSNAPTAFVRRSVEALNLNVPCVMGLDDVSEPKPSSAPYLELAQRLHLPNSTHPRIWVLEDSVTGVEAGLAADMHVLGITSQHSHSVLSHAGASETHASCLSVYERLKALSA
jgi:beta-phosphoglucomutase-like phosphatase (HAD superfamily)